MKSQKYRSNGDGNGNGQRTTITPKQIDESMIRAVGILQREIIEIRKKTLAYYDSRLTYIDPKTGAIDPAYVAE